MWSIPLKLLVSSGDYSLWARAKKQTLPAEALLSMAAKNKATVSQIEISPFVYTLLGIKPNHPVLNFALSMPVPFEQSNPVLPPGKLRRFPTSTRLTVSLKNYSLACLQLELQKSFIFVSDPCPRRRRKLYRTSPTNKICIKWSDLPFFNFKSCTLQQRLYTARR